MSKLAAAAGAGKEAGVSGGQISGSHRHRVLLVLIFLLGFALRLAFTGSFPANATLYQDEAYNAYDSWSILHYGYDSSGYTGAVYSAAWGSGQSIMATYLEMPFIALFGLNAFAVRLPREILGCLGMAAFYALCRQVRGEKFALVGTAILAIMPWHIMMSRWGLDCNYLPEFLLFAVLFLAKGIGNSRYFLLSGLFFGLSLYCYAAVWPFLPVMIAGCIIFLLAAKKIRWDRYLTFGLLITVVLAIPLLLFLAVNLDLLPEFGFGFFSFPKLSRFRSSELITGAKDLLRNMNRTLKLFVTQDDGRVSDVTPDFGLYYKFSSPVILYGMGCSLYHMIKKKENLSDFLMWMELICSIMLGAVVEVYFSRINIIHYPLTYFLAIGLYELITRFSKRFLYTAILLYGGAACAFMGYYVTDGDDAAAESYHEGIGYAVAYALDEEEDDTTIHVITEDIRYPQILFYAQFPTDEYLKTADFVYQDAIAAKTPISFGEFAFLFGTSWESYPLPGEHDIYIALHDDARALQFMQDQGMEMTWFDTVVVGVCR